MELCASVETSSREVNYYVAILAWPVKNAASWSVTVYVLGHTVTLRQDIHWNFDIILTLTEEFRPSQRSVDADSVFDFSEIVTVSFFNAVPKIVAHILKSILSTQTFLLIFYRSEAYSLASGEEHKSRDAIFIQRYQENVEFKKINHLKTNGRPLYLKTQSVPCCKNFSSRL